jgi:hypothetical protein
MKAIKKYENWVTFQSTHKIWMDTNGRPQIRDVEDRAMMARMHLIPFPASLSDAEVDRELPERMATKEAEGILAWLVAGAGKWFKDRLGRPEEAIAARDKWRDEMESEDPWENVVRDWIAGKEDEFSGTTASLCGERFTFSISAILFGAFNINPAHQDEKGTGHSARVGKIISRITDESDSPIYERFRLPRPDRGWAYRRITGKQPLTRNPSAV